MSPTSTFRGRAWPWILTVAIATPSLAGAEDDPLARPNVLLIMTDDQGWGDLARNGNEALETPVIDALASRSVRFDRFYVSPVCAPTRSALLTGRYPMRTGVWGVSWRHEVMRADEVTLAEAFRAAGYATACLGKWHNGVQYPNNPQGQGFGEFFGFLGGQTNDYFDTILEHNGREVRTEGYITDVLTDAALRFIDTNSDRPFLCYLPYNVVHTPWMVPDRYFDTDAARGLDPATACAYGMIANLDENIGRLLAKLEERDLSRRTIVVFLTDNGPNGRRYNGGMRGTKASVHEGGVRVPCFISWPGQLPPHDVRQVAAHIDLFPTLVDLCGIPMPRTKPLDGSSLVPLLRGEATEWPDRAIITVQAGRQAGNLKGAVRTNRHRFVREKGDAMLFDMVADPAQKRDVAADHPEVVDHLASILDGFLAEVRPASMGTPPIPVGFEEAPRVVLPTTEAELSGELAYANVSGYSEDWVVGWDAEDETIAWDLDVVRAGRFEVEMLYACPPEAIGSKVRLEVGSSLLDFAIERAFDEGTFERPERQKADEPRLDRVFDARPVGTIALPEGRVRLTLRALAIPGPIVCELDGLRLRRVD